VCGLSVWAEWAEWAEYILGYEVCCEWSERSVGFWAVGR
jgi:hypothetical protein